MGERSGLLAKSCFQSRGVSSWLPGNRLTVLRQNFHGSDDLAYALLRRVAAQLFWCCGAAAVVGRPVPSPVKLESPVREPRWRLAAHL